VGSPAELAAAAGREPLACRVRRGDRLLDASLAPGAEARPSAATPVLESAARAGTTPLELRLDAGDYLCVLRLAGHEEQRVALHVAFGRGTLPCSIPLVELGSSPTGFVRVVPPSTEWGPYLSLRPYWIQEREVTAGEYLEFLNDPATLAEVDAAADPIRVPRYGRPSTAEPLWERGPDGRYALPPHWRADWPVSAVSYADAEAYARWVSARAGAGFVFALPSEDEIEYAGHAGLPRHYTYGKTFRPKWARTCFARPVAGPGPVLRFPIDESPLGVFDLGGSAFEWVDAPWGNDGQNQRLAGGAWGRSDPEMLKVEGGIGVSPLVASGETGMRLVMRPAAEQR
jgi:hypothetical protein